MVDSGKALRTALPEFGQKLEMERKREEERGDGRVKERKEKKIN